MLKRQHLVIGLSGVTNGGKSSLTKKIRSKLPGCRTVSQDYYFLEPSDPRLIDIPELNAQNYEILESLEMDKMVSHIQTWKNDHGNRASEEPNQAFSNVLIVEGFRMYSLSDLEALFDKKYFLTIPYDVCKQRRSMRHYVPADVPGYFEKVVWPEYKMHLREIQSQHDIVYMDGTNDQEELCHKIVTDVKCLLNS